MNWLLLATITGFVWFGFVLHTSGGSDPVLGKYSPGYAAFLLGITICWIVSLWWVWRQRALLNPRSRAIAISISITIVIAALIFPGIYIYMHNRSLDETILKPINPAAHSFFQYEVAPDPPQGPLNNKKALRVLALGGSTTFGSKLERDQTYPAVLERLLRRKFPDTNVQVLNAGVSWHTSMHSLLRYVARYADWQPHIVIVMHAFNDIYQTSEGRLAVGEFRFDYGHFFGALGQRVNPRDQFRNQLRNAVTHNWLTRTWYSDLRGEEPRSEKAKVDLIRALPSFRRNLEALEKRVRQDGAHFVLATQPFLYRPDLSAEERDSLFYNYYYRDYAIVPTVEQQLAAMRRFNEATRSIAARLGSTLVDLEYHLPKTFEFLFDDVHYTIDGAKRVASIFAKNVPWDNFISDTLLEEQPRR